MWCLYVPTNARRIPHQRAAGNGGTRAMLKPTPDLLHIIDALRPKDYRITLIARNGSTTDSPWFATKAEARRWTEAHADVKRDVVVTHFAASYERN